MKRFLLLVASVALLVSACGGGDSDLESAGGDNGIERTETTRPATSDDHGDDDGDHGDDEGNIVVAKGLAFKPSTLRVKAGDQVRFNFDDGTVVHNAIADDGSFKTDNVTDKTVTVTIRKAGRIPYTCTLHPTMKGVIIAE